MPCVLSVKNHGTAARAPFELRLVAALGDVKKAKSKAADAFDIIAAAQPYPVSELAPRQQSSFSWNYQIDRNCPVSDKGRSLYLLFGAAAEPHLLGQLLITVKPHLVLEEVLKTLEAFFGFVVKTQKWSAGWFTVKSKPPASTRFALVEDLLLSMRFEDEALALKYVLRVRKVKGGAGESVGFRKGKSEFEQRLERGQYLMSGGFLNHEALQAALKEALDSVDTGL